MNKFALTTIAGLPSYGGGCAASLKAEVNKPREVPVLVMRRAADFPSFDEWAIERGVIVDPLSRARLVKIRVIRDSSW